MGKFGWVWRNLEKIKAKFGQN